MGHLVAKGIDIVSGERGVGHGSLYAALDLAFGIQPTGQARHDRAQIGRVDRPLPVERGIRCPAEGALDVGRGRARDQMQRFDVDVIAQIARARVQIQRLATQRTVGVEFLHRGSQGLTLGLLGAHIGHEIEITRHVGHHGARVDVAAFDVGGDVQARRPTRIGVGPDRARPAVDGQLGQLEGLGTARALGGQRAAGLADHLPVQAGIQIVIRQRALECQAAFLGFVLGRGRQRPAQVLPVYGHIHGVAFGQGNIPVGHELAVGGRHADLQRLDRDLAGRIAQPAVQRGTAVIGAIDVGVEIHTQIVDRALGADISVGRQYWQRIGNLFRL